MPSRSEKVFGQVALDLGFVTSAQVEECIRDQESESATTFISRFLGEIFMQKGYLTPSQVEQILRDQAGPDLQREDVLYGRIAFGNGFVTQAQIDECVRHQTTLKVPQRLGLIFLGKGFITPQQHRAVIKAQSRLLERFPDARVGDLRPEDISPEPMGG